MVWDRLVCIWQAIFAQTIAKGEDIDFANELRTLTKNCLKTQTGKIFQEDEFSAIVKHGYVSFHDFKTYIISQHQDDDIPDYLWVDQIEEKCWKICKDVYKSNLHESALRKMWQIINYLTLANSYPPIVNKEEIRLLCEKIATYINVPRKEDKVPKSNATFPELLEYLEEAMFKYCSESKVNGCIDKLHCWLVLKVCRTGWLHKRTKNGLNWTNWVNTWVVLVPGRLMFFENENPKLMDQPKSEIIINEETRVKSLCPYKCWDIKLGGRFTVLNPLCLELELATNDNEETKVWMAEIQQQISCFDAPVQKLVRQRYKSLQELAFTTKDNANILTKYLGINKGARGLKEKNYIDDSLKSKEEKLDTLYMKSDLNNNEFIDTDEFEKYIKGLGLHMDEKDTLYQFENKFGKIEFPEYLIGQVLDKHGSTEDIYWAFIEADRNGSGKMNIKEFSRYMLGKKYGRKNTFFKALSKMEKSGDGVFSISELKSLLHKEGSGIRKMPIDKLGESHAISTFEKQLQKTSIGMETDNLADLINGRWKSSFAAFKRQGASGRLVMTGLTEMVSDILPGNYNLADLVYFSDLPPLEPRHTVIKGVKWISSKVPGESGLAMFPKSFDGKVATEFATNEHLRYYGASFAENQQLQVSFCYHHGIQDFTYDTNYLEDYAKTRGCGLETHLFTHLNCPLHSDNGLLVLGKFFDCELHLTAFQVPVRHTVYVPAGTIHSNDYLIGTWRTMLSDEAVIDHVFIVNEKQNGDNVTYENIQLTF